MLSNRVCGRASRTPQSGRTRRLAATAVAIIAAATLAACGGGKSDSVTAPPGPLKTISLTPSTAALITGDTLHFVATLYDANSTVITTDTVSWKSVDPTIATITDSGTVKAVAAGTTKIVASSGAVSDSATITVSPPSTKAIAGLTAVSAGFSHTCAIGAGGVAFCWGDNSVDQLGNDTTVNTALPLQVSGTQAFVSLAAGYSHTCGLTAGGTAYCWGDNSSGELGNTTTAGISAAPVAVAGGLTFATLSAGYSHTCGVTTGGAAYCWGANESGELGNGVVGQDSPTPSLVAGGLTFASVSAGGVLTCGVTTSGAGYCWGANGYGVLGNGTTDDSAIPVAVLGGLKLASITAGVYHTCAVTTNGAAYCWGSGGNGQLGTGLSSLNSASPVAVAGGHTFTSIAVGEQSTCALTPAGAAFCWGAGSFGALGTGSTNQANAPQAVSGGQTFATLSAGISFHVCGLTTSGSAFCWGYNDSGELGDASAGGFSSSPQQVVVPNN